MRRALALIALLLLAGCSSTPTTSPSSTLTPVEPPPTASPTGTPPERATDTNTIRYSTLSTAERAVFHRALEGVVRFAPPSPYVDGETVDPALTGTYADHQFVVRNGTYYAVTLTQGRLYAQYRIEAEPSEPGPNATVVAFENVSVQYRGPVSAAVENGSYTTKLGELSSYGGPFGYVRYEGETYQLTVVVGDYWVTRLRVQPI